MLKCGYRFFPAVLSLFVAVLFLFAVPILWENNLLQAEEEGSTLSLYVEDCNNDNKINIADVIALLILGRDEPGSPEADYNGDGAYDITDVIALVLNIHNGNLTMRELYSISGRIVEDGHGLQGVQVILNNHTAEEFVEITTTDAQGMFSFENLLDGTYELKPVLRTFYYTFKPGEMEVIISGESVTVPDIQAFYADFALTGRIVEDYAGLADVAVSVKGEGVDTVVVTDSDGVFFLEHLFNAPYAVMPLDENYTFDPYSLAVIMYGDSTIQDITATPTGGTTETLYNITGRVFCAMQGLSNVTLVLSGDMEASTVTDANGDYILMVPNGVYTVVSLPIPLFQLFNPSSYNAVVEGADVTGFDFFGYGGGGGL